MKNVCAIVVTFNRKELLEECIENLLGQSRPIDKILVVDNASTDGTPEMVKDKFPMVELLALKDNVGGAGGFFAGMKWAHENKYEWLWILDDDTMANENALEEFIGKYDTFPSEKKPVVLASKVLWTDGTPHPMNFSVIRNGEYEQSLFAAEYGTINIRSSSFVSFMVNSTMIDKYGLPIKEYFIWNDDAEYSARVLKNEFGVLCPSSVVIHKTKLKYTPMESSGDRYYFEIRNKLWMLRTDSFKRKEKIKIFLFYLINIGKYLKLNKFRPKAFWIVLKGLKDGIKKVRIS